MKCTRGSKSKVRETNGVRSELLECLEQRWKWCTWRRRMNRDRTKLLQQWLERLLKARTIIHVPYRSLVNERQWNALNPTMCEKWGVTNEVFPRAATNISSDTGTKWWWQGYAREVKRTKQLLQRSFMIETTCELKQEQTNVKKLTGQNVLK